MMFRRAKERAQDKLYRDARVFITVAKEDARALRPHNPLRTGDHVESLGREFNQPMRTMYRLRDLYRRTYWNTLYREYGSTTFLRMRREDEYRRMGAYEQIARDVDELRKMINRIEQQMREES